MTEAEKELRRTHGEFACRIAAAYVSYMMGNALQTEYKKLSRDTVGTAWLVIAKMMMDLGPAESAERLVGLTSTQETIQ
jgi:hypothetical protein